MPQYIFRGNLNAARFPLVSTFMGRSIIIPQYDQNFQKLANFSGGDQDRDIGIPQVFYLHNVMPTAEGFQSVTYTQVIDAATPPLIDFDKAFIIRDVDENKGIFVPAAGQNYFYNGNTKEWWRVSALTPGTLPSNILVTVAYIRGRTLYFYYQINAYEYDFASNSRAVVVLNGLTIANINGICAAGNYLIAWDENNQVYWSSVTDITDFVPSLFTGAGSEKPNELRGDIVVILPMPNGFVIYTTRNAVLASYTGNLRFPWVFREIAGSHGVKEPDHVSWEANTSYHIAWTTAGLLKIEKTSAEPIFPEVTDFLAAKIFEDYNAVTETLIQEYLGVQLFVKVCLVNTRYLIISYGVVMGYYTHALVVDLALKRLGKLKIDHTDCFDWPAPNLFGVQTYEDLLGQSYGDLGGTTYEQLSIQQITSAFPKKNIAFLQRNGIVKILNFDLGDFTSDAVMFLGKFQMVRIRNIQHLETELENVDLANSNFELKIFASYDGKNFSASLVPMEVARTANVIRYQGRISGENLTLRINGSFNLVSLVETVLNAGDR